jgi:hypothetical protein
MKKKILLVIISIFLLLIVWCCVYINGLRTLPAGFTLTRMEYEAALKSALLGDASAADTLANYYMWRERPHTGLGLLFREKAAILGNRNSQILMRSYLDSYGIDNFREVVGKTNEVDEQKLLNLLLEEKDANTEP